MEKVTDKWFKAHGWKKTEEKYKHYDQPGDVTTHHIIYDLGWREGHAQVRCTVETTPAKKWRKKQVSRFYSFWATGGNCFTVENRISNWRFPVETIENALKVVEYKKEER